MQYSAGVEYAKTRVNSCKNKLDGINPCVITRDDLASGIHKSGKYLKYFNNVVLGLNVKDEQSKPILKRTKLLEEKGEKYKLTVEEQVECIIEQSIDPNILGRTWNGWQPYI
jgi:DNA-dependent protein kinase catalytic subunit